MLHAHVLNFGYNADITFGNTTADIRDHARDLLSSLVDKREEDEVSSKYLRVMARLEVDGVKQEIRRPIIFIAHSLGGIVAKQVSQNHYRQKYKICEF